MSTKHLTYLDSLRGLAALTVVFSHFIVLFLAHGSVIRRGYEAGELAVCLFFILSGFVLSQRFLGVSGIRMALIEAVIKRPFRLLGIVWMTIILGILVAVTVQGATISSYPCRTWTQFVIDFFISPFSTGKNYNGVLWTISWELYGSMMIYGILFCAGHLSKYLRLIIFAILLVIYMNCHYGLFIIGMIIADLHKNFYWDTIERNRNLLSVLTLILIVITSTMFYCHPIQQVLNTYLQDGAMLLVAVEIFVFTMFNTLGFRAVLDWPPVNFIGNISYSFYAIHYMIMKTIGETLNTILEQYMSRDMAWIGMVLISLTIIIFAAWIMDKYVDKPSISLSAKIAQLATSIISLEIAIRGSKFKLILMFRVPLALLRILISGRRNIRAYSMKQCCRP